LLVIFKGAIVGLMSEVTRIFSAIERGDPHTAEQLLPLVYAEMRQRLAGKSSGQTLQAIALVHEAYIRLVAVEKSASFSSRFPVTSGLKRWVILWRPMPCRS
jgi:ECF sigma factor